MILEKLYDYSLTLSNLSYTQKLIKLCEFFKGTNYGPWKNGNSFETLDDFNYDLQTLDCVTYVEVVLALMQLMQHKDYKSFVGEFEENLRKIHYKDGTPSFIMSNHFTCVDWIPNNTHILRDVTQKINNNARTATTTIEKKTWFEKHNINLDNKPLSDEISALLPNVKSNLLYIPTNDFIDNYHDYVSKFPQNSVICIVRPDWNMRDKIGTNLNISHMGFSIKDTSNSCLDFFHATIIAKKVVTEKLDVYMKKHLDSPTIKGICVLDIVAEQSDAR